MAGSVSLFVFKVYLLQGFDVSDKNLSQIGGGWGGGVACFLLIPWLCHTLFFFIRESNFTIHSRLKIDRTYVFFHLITYSSCFFVGFFGGGCYLFPLSLYLYQATRAIGLSSRRHHD